MQLHTQYISQIAFSHPILHHVPLFDKVKVSVTNAIVEMLNSQLAVITLFRKSPITSGFNSE